MNFLAHLYLAEDHPQSRVGNLLGDFVKGRIENLAFPSGILKGIVEHREIDRFTDTHPIHTQSRSLINPENRRFAGIAVDVIYDHFLARDWADYHPMPLQQFTRQCYQELREDWDILPPRLRFLFPYMESGDWLTHYAKRNGIYDSLSGLARRMQRQFQRPNTFETTLADFDAHYHAFEAHFRAFFPELQAHLSHFRATR